MKLMMAVIIALTLTTGSDDALSQEKKSLLQNPKTQDRAYEYCQDEHWRNPELVSLCMERQIEALARVESYIEQAWPKIGQDKSHPVSIILMDAVKESSVVVDGKPWADWTMVKFRFKRAMQDWLRAEGKTEELREISSVL